MAATPVPAPPERGGAGPGLERTMGPWMATALVVGNMNGPGVFMLPATPAGTAGPISLLGWVFITVQGVELGRGRGGPHRMSCPVEREELS